MLFLWTGLQASQFLLTVESEDGQTFLRRYNSPLGFANGEVLRRNLNVNLPKLNRSSKVEAASFGRSWGDWQIVTVSNLVDKVLIQVYEPPLYPEQRDLTLLSSIEITSELGVVMDLDMLCYDSMELSYDQIHLFCSTPKGLGMVTVVAPSNPSGGWRQSNWRKLEHGWPSKGFQLIDYQSKTWSLYDSMHSNVVYTETSNEIFRVPIESAQPNNLFVNQFGVKNFAMIDIKQRKYIKFSREDSRVVKEHAFEFSGDIIDVVMLEELQRDDFYSLEDKLFITNSAKLTKEGVPLLNWPEEDETFKLRFEVQYDGLSSLSRGKLNWKIWWKVESPRWDLQSQFVVPDLEGVIRRPLEPGDQIDFEKSFKWPYEQVQGKLKNQNDSDLTPYWAIITIQSEDGTLRARSELPWLARPMRTYRELSNKDKFAVHNFFEFQSKQWLSAGGTERSSLHFEGFFDSQSEREIENFSIEPDTFWETLQPWKTNIESSFDALWVESWNQTADLFTWPNWKNSMELFDSWKLSFTLSDNEKLNEGMWKLVNEFGDVVLQRTINNGEAVVVQGKLNEAEMKNLWGSQHLKEMIFDQERSRIYIHRKDQIRSGAEKLGWLWVRQGKNVHEERALPWHSGKITWNPLQEIFHEQGRWHLGLSDPDSLSLKVVMETAQGRFDKHYPFEWGSIQMPLNLEYGQSIHSIWLNKLSSKQNYWSKALHLFPMDEIKSIKQERNGFSTWLINKGEQPYLLSWKNLECQNSISLNELRSHGILRVAEDSPGAWLVLLEKSYEGHTLMTWAPQFKSQPCLGGAGPELKRVGDFCKIGDPLQRKVVVGDIEHFRLKLYSEQWELLDEWHKSGFSPCAIIQDPKIDDQFWVLDRRESGQSFLYQFLCENKSIRLVKVYLEPLPLGKLESEIEVGMSLRLDQNGNRFFAFSDAQKKMVYEYKLNWNSSKLEKGKEFFKSSRGQGDKLLFGPKDLIYLQIDDEDVLYALDDKDSFYKIK